MYIFKYFSHFFFLPHYFVIILSFDNFLKLIINIMAKNRKKISKLPHNSNNSDIRMFIGKGSNLH
jgi:hypothetical protein